MKPTHYLNLGGALVLLFVALIVGMNWFASDRVSQQYQLSRDGQHELQQLERMRTAVLRVVASTNESALIVLAKAGGETGATGEHGETGALETEGTLVQNAIDDFHASEQQSVKALPATASWVARATRAFTQLLDVNANMMSEINRDTPSGARVSELKEQQEVAESAVLEILSAERTRLQDSTGSSAAAMAASLSRLRNYALAAGLLAALILLASGVYISRRVGGMFDAINAHQRDMEKANADLNEAMLTLRRVQGELISKEKFATLGRLTATVSHELRNPLAAIRNSSFIIGQSASGVPIVADFVSRIERNVTRCDHIIADLLEYTKTRALDLQPVEIGRWLEECLKNELNVPGAPVCFAAQGTDLIARIDRSRFVRAIINLVENASHAIEGVKGKMAGGGQITLTCGRVADQVFIEVRDNGPGIPADLHDKIFEPLFTTKNFGAGLGLSITSSLVAEHGGKITLTSAPGTGTAFRITLPGSASPAAEVAA